MRNINWAGMTSQVNYACVVCKDDFDKVLLEDTRELLIIRRRYSWKIDFQDKVRVKIMKINNYF
ncbi:hypothetical protein [Arcobacter sp.]|uniref:hypothetical protein n=1 Tax=Arcobacter sp. TaxID=1872629 RepID=UPI003C795E23